MPRGRSWTEEENDRLLALWNNGADKNELAAQFPGRTLAAVGTRASTLRKAGRSVKWRNPMARVRD